MKKTSKDLLVFLGLKIGDKIRLEENCEICEIQGDEFEAWFWKSGERRSLLRFIYRDFMLVRETLEENEKIILSMLKFKYEKITRVDGELKLIYYIDNIVPFNANVRGKIYEDFDQFDYSFKGIEEDVEYNIKELLK